MFNLICLNLSLVLKFYYYLVNLAIFVIFVTFTTTLELIKVLLIFTSIKLVPVWSTLFIYKSILHERSLYLCRKNCNICPSTQFAWYNLRKFSSVIMGLQCDQPSMTECKHTNKYLNRSRRYVTMSIIVSRFVVLIMYFNIDKVG